MNILPFFLQLAALLCMVFAAFNLFPNGKVQWGWLGLAFWVCSFMVETIGLHQASSIH
jgi:steroid 5-alpha reductase family enzyme